MTTIRAILNECVGDFPYQARQAILLFCHPLIESRESVWRAGDFVALSFADVLHVGPPQTSFYLPKSSCVPSASAELCSSS